VYRHVVWLVAAAGLLLGGSAGLAQNADTVDGFDAYSTPHANALLALNGSARMSGAVIADNSMPGSRLVPGAVTAGRLGNNSVTTDKISDGQVMSADLAAGAVTQSKIANNSVTNTKIKNGTILGEDLGIPLLIGGSRDGYLIGCFNGSTSSSASGITGYSTATSGHTRGVVGACNSPSGKGVYGVAKATSGTGYGVYGETASLGGIAIYGENTANSNYGYIGGPAYGVYARAVNSDGTGVYGACNNGSNAWGIAGFSASGYAGYFGGNVRVSGDLDVTGGKNFKIDHPLDPENMYLYHSCVESSERMNIYNGKVALDQRGEAWVQLPDWFEAVNCDFLYQLTPVGAPGPNLYVAQEIHDGCFGIAGGIPGMTVCWQVTGTRADPYALAHPFEVEVDKPEQERGSYLHPELYGMPETMSIEWATKPEAMMELLQQ
jgi:hypothetical protein